MPRVLPMVQARLAPGSLVDSFGRFLVEPVEPATMTISYFARPWVGEAATEYKRVANTKLLFQFVSLCFQPDLCIVVSGASTSVSVSIHVCGYYLCLLFFAHECRGLLLPLRPSVSSVIFTSAPLYMVLDIVSKVLIYQNVEVPVYRTCRTWFARYIGVSSYRTYRTSDISYRTCFTRYIEVSMYRDISYIANLFCPPAPGMPRVFLQILGESFDISQLEIISITVVLFCLYRIDWLFCVGFVSIGYFDYRLWYRWIVLIIDQL